MRGVGERLGPALDLPPLAALLVNPGVHLDTRQVFGKLGLKPGEGNDRPAHPDIPGGCAAPALHGLLRRTRNDMEDAAGVLVPVIGDVLAVLSAAQGVRLVRMSGSGTTCFAVFDDCRAASRAAKTVRRGHPDWWVKSTILR